METFCRKLIENYSEFFKKEYQTETYPNQDVKSCASIITKCLQINPDCVIDIGTNYGASTLSLACALKNLGKDLSCLTTIDKELSYWTKTVSKIQNELMVEYDINPCKINTTTADFKLLDAQKTIPPHSKIFLFYDIHDIEEFSFFKKFVEDWVPLLKEGIIGIHDVSSVPKDFQSEYPDHVLANHFSGKTVSGFLECNVIMDWLNKVHKDFYPVKDTSIIYVQI